MSDVKLDKMADKINNVDKLLSILNERLLNFIDKIENLEKDIDKNNIDVALKFESVKNEIKEIKKDIENLKDETKENSKNRKLTNKIVWIIFTSLIALVFYIIKQKITKP